MNVAVQAFVRRKEREPKERAVLTAAAYACSASWARAAWPPAAVSVNSTATIDHWPFSGRVQLICTPTAGAVAHRTMAPSIFSEKPNDGMSIPIRRVTIPSSAG